MADEEYKGERRPIARLGQTRVESPVLPKKIADDHWCSDAIIISELEELLMKDELYQ